MALPYVSPTVDILGRKLKDQNPSPTHPDQQLWPWSGCHSLTPKACSHILAQNHWISQRELYLNQNARVRSKVRSTYCSHTRSGSAKHYETQWNCMISYRDLWCLGNLQQRDFGARINLILDSPKHVNSPLDQPIRGRIALKRLASSQWTQQLFLQTIEFFE